MTRLELSDQEVPALPNMLAMAVEKRMLPNKFDEAQPENPFMPHDLFDEKGPWVPFSYRKDDFGALSHLKQARFRSIFVPQIRVSDRREDTLEYLKRASEGRSAPALPDGTALALVRMTVLPTTSGSLSRTPLIESLQLIVVNRPEDQRFKFILDRQDLLAGGSGLQAVTAEEPVDAYGFEAGGLSQHWPEYDADGEMLLFGRFPGSADLSPPSLGHCAACHGRTVGNRLFANSSRGWRAEQTEFEDQVRMILDRKSNDFSWGMYQALRELTR